MPFRIRTQLVIFTLIITVLVGGAISTYALFAQRDAIYEQFDEEARAIVSLLSETLIAPLYALKVDAASQLLVAARKNPYIVRAYALDQEGLVLSDGTTANAYRDEKLPAFALLHEEILRSRDLVSRQQEDQLVIGSPVVTPAGELLGFVHVEFSLEPALAHMQRETSHLVGIILGLFVLAGIFAVVLAQWFARPIKSMVTVTEAIAQGNFDVRVSCRRCDELARLSHSINYMAQHLRSTTVSKEYADHIIQSMKDSLIVTDAALTIRTVNQATLDLLGYREDELIEKPLDTIVPVPKAYQSTRNALVEWASRGEIERTYRTKDGNPILVSLTSNVMEDNNGDFQGLVCVTRNITDRKQAEDALRQSEERFRNLIESSIQGIVIHRDWKPLFVNQAYAAFLSYDSPDEILAMGTIERVFAPHERERLRRYKERRKKGEPAPTHYEYDALCKDGSIITMHNAVRVVDWKGEPAVQSTVIDITQQKRAQKEIESLSRRNALILNSAGEGIYGLDLEGRATFVNPAAAAMLGWQVEELVGKEQHPILHHTKADGTAYPSEECPIYAAFKDGGVHHVDSEMFWRKDGMSFPVEYVSTPIREDGKVVGAVVTFRDISERRELETQLQQAQKLESIGQLAAGIAHESNTPIQFVGDNTRFLKEAFDDLAGFMDKSAALINIAEAGPVPEALIKEAKAAMADADLDYLNQEIPSAITQSLEGIERVAKIVRAMKDFSHPGTEKKAIDLNRAIETTITVARNEWKYVAEMVTDFDPALPAVPCLASEFNQVILNLITNAAHAIADANAGNNKGKGTITITTRHVDDFAQIRIMDTGTGITKDVKNRVFDHFFTTKEVGKGTGQGLSIAHTVIVKKHSGEIKLDSEVGRGTTFIVRLPLTDPDELSAGVAA